MSATRRRFLFEGPAVALGAGGLAGLITAQGLRSNARIAPEVADFWVHGMGLPANTILGGDQPREGTRGLEPTNFAREPLFLHYDPDEKTLVLADQIPPEKLMSSGDTKVDFQMVRLRLNGPDDKQFRSYSSGGIYLDLQQQQPQQPATQSSSDGVLSLASSIFSAIFPGDKNSKPANSSGPGNTKSSPASPGKAQFQSQFQSSNSGKSSSPTAVPLQQANQAQSISLPGGLGKTAFACFAKDRKKSAFGQFISALSQVGDPSSSYLSLLSLPLIVGPTLNAIRTLVANLQAHGGDQQWILQAPPTDVSATADGCKILPAAVRLRPGFYIAVPKEQASAVRDQLSKLKILDGFLVPKEATPFDVYDTYATTAPEISYVSLNVNVSKTKSASCQAKE